jgi:nucleoside-diphosphate-sugar epimerase
MAKERVLITGMSGLIGGIMRRALEDKYELVALNRRAVPGLRCYQADIADLAAIRPAFAGVRAVLHLAAYAHAEATLAEVLPSNIIGTYNVYEAARQAGVQRVVFASSGAVISAYERDAPYSELVKGPSSSLPDPWSMITHQSPFRPQDLYGCSKVWGEVVGRHYCDRYGLSVVCVRIGAVTADDRPTTPRHFSVWCSHRDVAQMLEKCIAAPAELSYDVFYAVSNNRRRYRDVAHAREVLGYLPLDSADGVPGGLP